MILLVAFYFKHSVDLTNNLLLPWFVTLAEIGVGIVGACLPCLMVSVTSLSIPMFPVKLHTSLESLTQYCYGDAVLLDFTNGGRVTPDGIRKRTIKSKRSSDHRGYH